MPDKATPSERSLRGSIASHESWARTEDRAARTAPARRALFDKFEHEADPDGVLSPADRQRRAEHLRKAYFQRLALKSARARRKAKEARDTAVDLEEQADEVDAVLKGGE